MMEKAKGFKVMCRAINGVEALPLQFAERDQEGPQEQARGMTATNLQEVDGIAGRRCLEIYKGKFEYRHRNVASFMKRYAKQIGPKADVTQLYELD